MQAMIDQAAAVVIGATILLILLALSTRSNDSAVEATQVDLAKTELRLLMDVIEQDFANMGSGMGNPNTAITKYVIESGFHVLRFSGLQDDTGTPNPVPVEYRWRQQGTATMPSGSTVDTYEVKREVGGSTMYFNKATNFTLTLRKDELGAVPVGSIADSLALVRYVDVAIGMIPPIGTEDLLQQTQWTKRFRPINLDTGSRRLVAARP